jgi:anti-anti-sigma factor
MRSRIELTVRAAAQNPGVAIVTLSGNLDTHTAPAASAGILDALQQSAAGLILDFAAVDFISSAGISVLIDTQKKAQTAGKQLALVHIRPNLYKIFKIAALDQVFRFFEEESDAMQALWPAA